MTFCDNAVCDTITSQELGLFERLGASVHHCCD